MTRLEIPGGSYCECLPSGEFAALMADHLKTHLGNLPLPDGDRPLYLRITATGGFQIAGQSHAGRGTWHWHHGQWHLDPRISNGISGHIFDRDGVLRIIEPGPGVTSQGYRYVAADGRLVLGDETYADPVRILWEYTEHDGIAIGQGAYPVVALVQGTRRIIEPGVPPSGCTFIRFNKTGDNLAVACVKPEGAILIWVTVAELQYLPEQVLTPDLPSEPSPEPSRPPVPTPEPTTMMLPDDVHATFVAMVAKFPHTGDDDARRDAMAKAVATIRARHGLRWVWKTEHRNLSSPSKDALGYVPASVVEHGAYLPMYLWDMVNGTTREPNPPHESEPLRAAYVLAVTPHDWLGNEPAPDPDPLPPDPPPSLPDQWAELDRLWAVVEQLQAQRVTVEDVRSLARQEVSRLRAYADVQPTWRHTHTVRVTLRQDD